MSCVQGHITRNKNWKEWITFYILAAEIKSKALISVKSNVQSCRIFFSELIIKFCLKRLKQIKFLKNTSHFQPNI